MMTIIFVLCYHDDKRVNAGSQPITQRSPLRLPGLLPVGFRSEAANFVAVPIRTASLLAVPARWLLKSLATGRLELKAFLLSIVLQTAGSI